MELSGKEFQYVSEPLPVLQDSGKLSKQKLKFGMEEILGRVSDSKPSVSPLPPVKAYLKRSPVTLLQVPNMLQVPNVLQVPKVEPRVSPIQPSGCDVPRHSDSDMHCDSSFR